MLMLSASSLFSNTVAGTTNGPATLRRGAKAGGSHISVVTMGANLTTVDGHIEAIKRWRDVYNSVR